MYERANSSALVPTEYFTSRKAKAKPQRALAEKLEDRRMFNITGFQFNGPGEIQEGQAACFQIFANTNHDYVWGQQVHAHIDWGDYTSEDITWASGTQQDLYHVYTHAQDGAVSANATFRDDAGDGRTYNWTSSTESMGTDTYITDAPLMETDPLDSIVNTFQYEDTHEPRPVARFYDANPYARPNDFYVLSLDWGDGTTGAGYIQKDVDGVNWDVVGYHGYTCPNPATSLEGDGKWIISATVMDTNAGGSEGQTVQANGKAKVLAPDFLNATDVQANPPYSMLPPPFPQPLPPQTNGVIPQVINPNMTGVSRVSFWVSEYCGQGSWIGPVTNAHIPISASSGPPGSPMLGIYEYPDSNATIVQPWVITQTGVGPITNKQGVVTGYAAVNIVLTIQNAFPGDVDHLRVWDLANGADTQVRINFNV